MLTPTQQNILVDTTGHARITDAGLAADTQDLVSVHDVPAENGHNMRWAAPETLDAPGAYGEEADIFSFAGVMIEVCYR